MSEVWEEVPPGDPARVVLDRHYGRRPAGVTRLRRESVNTVYMCHVAGEQDLVLKRLGRTMSAAFLDFQERSLALAAAAGLPLPHPVAGTGGRTTVRAEGSAWQLAGRLAGRRYADGDAGALRAVAACVRRLHGLTADGAPPDCENPTRDVEQWLDAGPGEFDRLMEAIGAAGVAREDERRFRDAVAPAVDRALRELDRATYDGLPHALTHGELTGSNVLMAERGPAVTGLLDWDGVFVRPRVYDLARGALFLARRRRDGFEVDHRLVTDFLTVAAGDHPLSDTELGAIIPVLELFLAATARHVRDLRRESPGSLAWALSWSAAGASQVRSTMQPALDAYRRARR